MHFPQVGQSVNAKFMDGKYYGAFIWKVNDDDTYDVYYFEDSVRHNNVSKEDIKAPMMTGKTSAHWDKYRSKVFFDNGGEDGDGNFFEPGEFEVGGVTTDTNFICRRLGGDGKDEGFDIGYVIKRIRVYEEE